MHPIICKIGHFTVYSYGFMFALATLVCIFLLSREGKKKGFNPDVLVDLVFWILVSAIIGARFFYVLLNLSFFQENPEEIFMLWHGGLVWYGGLITSVIFGIFYLRLKKLPVLKTLDLLAPYVALGQAIGRIGCFLNGCCFGKPSSFGFYNPLHQIKLFPIQLVSSFNLFVIFLFLKLRQKRQRPKGEILFLYLVLASAERFISEFARNDSPRLFWNLTIFQIISAIIFIISLNGTIFLHARNRR